jgi:hypothetical protein
MNCCECCFKENQLKTNFEEDIDIFFKYLPESLSMYNNIQNILFIIKSRYIRKLNYLKKEKNIYECKYYHFMLYIQLLSLIIPAFLSIQYVVPFDNISNPIYWITFFFSILLGIITSYFKLFRIDQKFIMNKSFYFEFQKKGWLLLEKLIFVDNIEDFELIFKDFCRDFEQLESLTQKQELSLITNKNESILQSQSVDKNLISPKNRNYRNV